MPYTQLDGGLVFIKLEPFKPVFGTWKKDEGKEFIHVRKIDYSSLVAGDWEKFTKSFTKNQDWYIPIKRQEIFNWNCSALTVKPKEGERPELSWIVTPANQRYLIKTRLSASGMMGYGAAAMAVLNPITSASYVGSAWWWFSQKQNLRYNLSKNRGERSPSIIPKVFTRKCWFVDPEKYNPYEYSNQLLKNNLV